MTREANEAAETTHTGGCRCGAVRFVGRARTPLRSVVCACPDCQRSSGTFLSVNVGFAADAFEVTEGEALLASWSDTGESGQPVHRSFCSRCGSPLFARPEAAPHLVSVRSVALDDPITTPPAFGIFAEHIPAWVELPSVEFYDE